MLSPSDTRPDKKSGHDGWEGGEIERDDRTALFGLDYVIAIRRASIREDGTEEDHGNHRT